MPSALHFKSTLDDSNFQRKLREMEEGSKRVAGHIGGGFKAMGGLLAGVGISTFASQILDLGGKLQDTSDALSLDVEILQGLQHAFAQSGASAEQFEKGMVKLTQSIEAAKGGNEKMIEAFAELGVSAGDLERLETDEIIFRIADASKDATDKGKNLAAIMEVWGKGGARMAGGLKQGSDALKELSDNAAKFSQQDVQRIADTGDKMANAWRAFQVGLTKTGFGGMDAFAKLATTPPTGIEGVGAGGAMSDAGALAGGKMAGEESIRAAKEENEENERAAEWGKAMQELQEEGLKDQERITEQTAKEVAEIEKGNEELLERLKIRDQNYEAEEKIQALRKEGAKVQAQLEAGEERRLAFDAMGSNERREAFRASQDAGRDEARRNRMMRATMQGRKVTDARPFQQELTKKEQVEISEASADRIATATAQAVAALLPT